MDARQPRRSGRSRRSRHSRKAVPVLLGTVEFDRSFQQAQQAQLEGDVKSEPEITLTVGSRFEATIPVLESLLNIFNVLFCLARRIDRVVDPYECENLWIGNLASSCEWYVQQIAKSVIFAHGVLRAQGQDSDIPVVLTDIGMEVPDIPVVVLTNTDPDTGIKVPVGNPQFRKGIKNFSDHIFCNGGIKNVIALYVRRFFQVLNHLPEFLEEKNRFPKNENFGELRGDITKTNEVIMEQLERLFSLGKLDVLLYSDQLSKFSKQSDTLNRLSKIIQDFLERNKKYLQPQNQSVAQSV